MTRYVTTEKVVVAWLASLPGITAAMVDPQLPPPDSNGNLSWAASGFITPYGLGGAPNIYVPVAKPVVGLKCWTVDPTTGVPPWNKAANLAETIRAGCFTNSDSQFLTIPYADWDARLISAYMLTEPRRAFGDLGDYACFDCEVQLHWHAH
jgi:hypothetical protein